MRRVETTMNPTSPFTTKSLASHQIIQESPIPIIVSLFEFELNYDTLFFSSVVVFQRFITTRMPSVMFLSFTKANWFPLMASCITSRIQLERALAHNFLWSGDQANRPKIWNCRCTIFFGIRVRKVAFKLFGIFPLEWNSLKKESKSSSIVSQHSRKKFMGKPSGQGAFSFRRSKVALLISSNVNSFSRREDCWEDMDFPYQLSNQAYFLESFVYKDL